MINKIKVPNLFLVGAPKCGTTTLVDWLSSSGDVFVPRGREPHFFADDIFPERVCNTLERYEALYAKAPMDTRYYLDGSTGYLSSSVAIEAAVSHCANAKFVASVRDPAEMIISLHRERANEGREKELSARKAWIECTVTSEPVRKRALDYKFQCDLPKQIKHIRSVVPHENLLILTLKEIAEEPEMTYTTLMDFLDVPFTEYPNFHVHGAAISRRSVAAQSLIFGLKMARQKLGIPPIGLGVFKSLESMNTMSKSC